MRKIFISAGHYRDAQGARWLGNTEWQEATVWRDEVYRNLGHDLCELVPSSTLTHKVEYINSNRPLLAVEIHFNSAIVDGEHVGDGSETLYYPGSLRGKVLAEYVQDALARVFPPDRGVKEGWYRQDRPGIVDYHGDVDGDETPLYFLKQTACPAIIIEPEFIHHIDLIRERRQAACAALSGVLREFTTGWPSRI